MFAIEGARRNAMSTEGNEKPTEREERKKSLKRKKSEDEASEEDDEDRDKRRQRRRAGRKKRDNEDSDSDGERRKARRRRKRRERERDDSDSDGGGRRRHRDRRRSRSRSADEKKGGERKSRRSKSGSAEPDKERRRDAERAQPPPRAPLTVPPPPPPLAAGAAPERKRVSKWDVPEGAPGAAPPVPPPGMGMNATNTGPSMHPMDAAKQARRLYVGNIPADTPPAEVVAFLNLTMQDAGLTKYTQPVQAVHQGNSFMFVELPDANEANELLKCDGALFLGQHLKLRKPTNNPGAARGENPQRGAATPGPSAPLSELALPPDPMYDQAAHQLGMARPYARPTYANVMARFAARLDTDTGVQDF